MIITIDGPAGTGKSTVAKRVAKRLGFAFFDTGAIYRSLAYFLQGQGIEATDIAAIAKQIPLFHYEIHTDQLGEKHYFVQGQEVTKEIRSSKISELASQISAYPEVREGMLKMQREFGGLRSSVFEGRDMGTVVFPNAELKIFLTARPQVRAKRRYEELLRKFPDLSDSLHFDQILEEMEKRDQNDTERAVAPLKQAADAILIDTSDLTIDQVTRRILQLAAQNRKYPAMRLPYRICYLAARWFFQLFFRLKIYGLEHFQTGSAILAANHSSNYDPPVLSISCPEEVFFLAKDSLFRIPLLGPLIRLLNARPVSGKGTDASTLREIIGLLQSGKKVILFPEGTRSSNGELQSLERGIGFIAHKAGAPILPAYIDGTFAAWPQGKKFPKLFGKMRVVFGSPIEWEDWEHLGKRELEQQLTDRVATAFQALKSWLATGAKGLPP